MAPADYPFSCTGISGYSGGGKKMIADYESPDRPAHSKLDAPKSYGLSLAHKHLPEMQEISGLARTPAFVPVVCDYYSGMQVLVPLDLKLAGTTAEAVAEGIANYYKDAATIKVHALNETLPENGLYSNAMAGSDRMELYMTVNAAGDQMMLVSLFDNLGKGSSGAAIQCMNLMLGLPKRRRAWNKTRALCHGRQALGKGFPPGGKGKLGIYLYAVSRSCGRHLCAQGFAAAGVHCGIRANHSEKYDLALIKADVRCAAAGVYTTNKVCGAPIKVDRAHLKDGYAQAILVNSGNANTCAANGVALAEECCALVGKALHIDAKDVLPSSTGVIGQPMVIDPFARGIPAAAASWRLMHRAAPMRRRPL